VAAHEIGHALGISHSEQRGALMFAWYDNYNPVMSLSDDDKQAIRQLYGQSLRHSAPAVNMNIHQLHGAALPNKYTTFGQLIIRDIITIIATRCHILRLKCTTFDPRRLSVRSFVCPSARLCLRWSLTLTQHSV